MTSVGISRRSTFFSKPLSKSLCQASSRPVKCRAHSSGVGSETEGFEVVGAGFSSCSTLAFFASMMFVRVF